MNDKAKQKQKLQWVVLGVLGVIALIVGGKLLLQPSPQAVRASPIITAQTPAAPPAKITPAAIAPLRPVVVDWPADTQRDPFGMAHLLPAAAVSEPATKPDTTQSQPKTRNPNADDIRKLALSQLRIQGMITGSQPRVVINGTMCGIGDVVGGFTVRQIASRRVVLEKDGIAVDIDM